MDDDELEISPWPVMELVGQLVARASLGRRGAIESDPSLDAYERETDRFELEAWARVELVNWLTLRDFQCLDAAAGKLTDEDLAHCHDGLMEASTIAWALSIVQEPRLPVFSTGEPEHVAASWAPGPWTALNQVTGGLRVRADEQLAVERERWEILYWRLLLPTPLDAESATALRETVAEVRAIDLLATQGDDLSTDGGVALASFSPDQRDRYAHEAEIRLRTLNWTCGLGERLDTTPLLLDDEEL